MAIEVEKKALLTEEIYRQLPDRILSLGGKDTGNQDTNSIFYVVEGAQVKLQSSPNHGWAKLAWKSGDFDDGKAARKEVEVKLAPREFNSAEQFFDALLPGVKKVPTTQKRHNFELDQVAIAVKFSDHWGYHVEFDQMVETPEDVSASTQHIQQVADSLGISLLTPDEEKAFVTGLLKKI